MPENGPISPEQPEPAGNGARASAEFDTLRYLLVGPEQQRLRELADRLKAIEITPAELADHLPEAIALRSGRDRKLGRALAPTVETALRESIRRNPREIASAIFPVLGPAIRKAIAETMAGLVRSINSAVEHSLSFRGLKWRVESWRTGVPFPEIVLRHALVYRVEQIFLIHAETGLLLSHVAPANLRVPDGDLISGMLTAIQDFVRDSFRPGEGATLRTFTVGEYTVRVEVGPRALLAAVIRGQAPESLTQRLQTTLESVHLEFASQLTDFSGDGSAFEPVRPLLEECLETVVSISPTGKPGRLVWLRWAFPLLLLVVTGSGLWLSSRLRWQRAVRALEAEPGVVVVAASRGWREWRFTGFKDPLARDPVTVLAGAGFSPRTVSGRWESYLSLDSAMVVERARRVLSVPPALTLSLHGDNLVFGGVAPINWLAAVRAAGPPPGATGLDLSAVEPVLPMELDSLRRAIEADRVLFDPGSFRLAPVAAARLEMVATRFRRLAAGVTSAGASVRLDLVGRTDPTGSEEVNQALAQWRVDQVGGRLASLGVGPDLIARHAIATARPLPTTTPAERASINRSVSFEVTLWTGPEPPRGQ